MEIKPNDKKRATPFKAWTQKVLPTVYDDSLSYGELLYKVLNNINILVENNNLMIDDIQTLYDYVNDYFENLNVQTEIDNKLEQMYNSGQLDNLFQRYLDPKINQQNEMLTTTLNNQNNKITVLESRMNEFSNLKEGSTTGDAELADGRIGFDGKVYPNIGDAIRGQAQQLSNEINDLYDKYSLDYIKRYYDTVTGDIKSGFRYEPSSNSIVAEISTKTLEIDLVGNEHIIITGIDNMYMYLYTVLDDENNILLSYKPDENTVYDVTTDISVPENAKKLHCNFPVDNSTANIIVYSPTKTFYAGGFSDYQSLTKAILDSNKYWEPTIIVADGDYDLVSELLNVYGADFFTNYNGSVEGIPLQNGVKLIFSANNTVTLNYTGDNELVQEKFSAFYPGDYGCTIIGMNLTTKNIRYAIHDERNGKDIKNHNIYKNCNITHDSSGTTWGPHQCIGGGFGKSSLIEIENCKFNSVGCDYAVSYHNSNDLTKNNYKSKVILKDCYFEHGSFYIGNYGQGTRVSEGFVSNCSVTKEPSVVNTEQYPMNVALYSWNNIIRN